MPVEKAWNASKKIWGHGIEYLENLKYLKIREDIENEVFEIYY